MLDQYEMCNVSAIVALPILNEHFRPDQIGNGRNLYLMTKKVCCMGIFEPIISNGSNEVRGAEYKIDVQFAFEDFGDPPLVVYLGLKTERRKSIQDFRIIPCLDENVDILCRAAQSRVCIDGKSAGDHECEFRVF